MTVLHYWLRRLAIPVNFMDDVFVTLRREALRAYSLDYRYALALSEMAVQIQNRKKISRKKPAASPS